MSLSLVRVDDRLIHGQTVIMWSKYRQGDAMIILVPAKIAADRFTVSVLKNAGNVIGKKVYIFNVAEAIEKVPKAILSDKKYYLISKSIQELSELRKNGIDYGKELIFGAASYKPDSVKVANNIYLDQADMDACDYLTEQGVNIVFKLIPDDHGSTWEKCRENLHN